MQKEKENGATQIRNSMIKTEILKVFKKNLKKFFYEDEKENFENETIFKDVSRLKSAEEFRK